MRKTQKAKVLLGAALSSALLSACGASTQSNTSSPTTYQTTTTSPAATTTPNTTPLAATLFYTAVSVTDSYGYDYWLGISFKNSEATESIANALPGTADIDIHSSGSLTITNTTPGRSALVFDLFTLGPNVGGLFRSNRPACALSEGAVSLWTAGRKEMYCWIQFGTAQNYPVSGSAAGGYLAPNNPLKTYFNSGAQELGNVKQSQASRVVSDLNQGPNYWALVATVGSTSITTSCNFVNSSITSDLGIIFTKPITTRSCSDARF